MFHLSRLSFLRLIGTATIASALVLGFTVVRAQNADVWAPEATATSVNLWGLTAVQDTLVAVGEQGTIETYAYADATWRPRSSGVAVWLTGVASDGKRLVVVGDLGTILTSDDLGASWTARRSPTTKRLNNVAYGDGRWVAVGEQGVTVISADGETWTAGPVLGSGFLRGLAFGQHQFVAGGQNRMLFRSQDGITFSPLPIDGTADIEGVAISENHLWVAGSDGLLATSTDFTSWVYSVLPSHARLRAVTVRNADNASAVGDNAAATYTAENGSWRPSDVVAPPPPFTATAVVQAHNQLVSVGFNGQAARSAQGISGTIELSPSRPLYGQSLTLRFHATEPNQSFQWLRNGVAIAGATNATFVLASATPATVAGLAVQVSSRYSAPVTVTAGSASGGITLYAAGRPNITDPDFHFGVPSVPAVVAPMPDGKYLVAGPFTVTANLRTFTGLARLLHNGDVDATFPLERALPVGSAVAAIYPLADGRAVVRGNFTTLGGHTAPGLARLRADGSFDPSFAPPATLAISDAIVSPHGAVWVRLADENAGSVVPLRDDGSVDASVPPIDRADLISADSRDRVIVCVRSTQDPSGGTLMRYLRSGVADPSYTPTGVSDAVTLRFLRSVAGDAGVYQLKATSRLPLPLKIVRYLPDGGVDAHYALEGGPYGGDVFARNDGTIVVSRTTGVVETYSPTGQLATNVYLTPADQSGLSILAFDADEAAITSNGRLRPIVGTSALTNVSIRATVPSSIEPLIAGFAVRGAGTSGMLVRAIGPALANYGVSGVLADPQVSVVRDGGTVATNDNWSASVAAAFASVGAFALPPGSKDAAVTLEVSDGPYTAVVTPTSSIAGAALAEAYLLPGALTAPRLINVSGRSTVTSESGLIAGFTIAGSGPATVLIRGVGPGLAKYGVNSPLGAPRLVLWQGTTALWENTQWTTDAKAATATASVGAFTLAPGTNDCAMVVTLAPGSYTAVVTTRDGAAGAALAEIYLLP